MSAYSNDRKFTDFVHSNLAIPLIYEKLQWNQVPMSAFEARKIDIEIGVDYVFEKDQNTMTVQERFRDKKYVRYNDFTIRYEREKSKFENQIKSEFYKMKADFFVYGIINENKENFLQASDFLKFAIIDLKKVYEKILTQEIVIINNGRNYCYVQKGVLFCPVKFNTDQSSSFFPIDILCLIKLWGNEMILLQKGFST